MDVPVVKNNNFVIHHHFKNTVGEERSTKLEVKPGAERPSIYVHNGRRSDGTKIYGRFELSKENCRLLIEELQKHC